MQKLPQIFQMKLSNQETSIVTYLVPTRKTKILAMKTFSAGQATLEIHFGPRAVKQLNIIFMKAVFNYKSKFWIVSLSFSEYKATNF